MVKENLYLLKTYTIHVQMHGTDKLTLQHTLHMKITYMYMFILGVQTCMYFLIKIITILLSMFYISCTPSIFFLVFFLFYSHLKLLDRRLGSDIFNFQSQNQKVSIYSNTQLRPATFWPLSLISKRNLELLFSLFPQ